VIVPHTPVPCWHCSQVSPQADSQHTPLLQKPVAHCAAAEQLAPCFSLQPVASQLQSLAGRRSSPTQASLPTHVPKLAQRASAGVTG
jgi:hypothetical protein